MSAIQQDQLDPLGSPMDIEPTYLFNAFMCLSPFLVVSVVVCASAPALRLCPSPGNPRLGDKHTLFLAPVGTQL